MKRLISPLGASLLVCSLILGCGSSSKPVASPVVHVAQAQGARGAGAPAQGEPVQGPGEAAAPPVNRKIVYTSQIDVVVENLAEAQQRLMKLIESVREQGGYLARQEFNGTSGSQRRGSWTIRVPLAQFDGFVAELEQLGNLERNSRDAQDVTEAYADLEARLRNKQSSEARLLGHLEKSAALKDTLELERELSRVRGEVEQLQGQLNLLKSKTDLATVTVTLLERQIATPPPPAPPPPTPPTFGTQVARTFERSCQTLIAFTQVLTLIGVALAPWLVVAATFVTPVWLIGRYWKMSRV